MTWDPQAQAFICGRGRQPCRGTGRPVVVLPPDEDYPERRTCPVCGREDRPTYQTEDGRTVLLAH